MKKQKSVCMIAYTNYDTDARVRREAETLAAVEESFCVIVFCLRESDVPKTYFKEGVCVRELDTRKYAGNSKLRYLLSYLRFLTMAFLACSWLSLRKGIDVVHVHNMPNLLILAALVPKLLGKPLVLDMHDSVPETFLAKFAGGTGVLFRILCMEERLSAWMSDRIICVNEVQKEVTVARGVASDKISVFMNVPDHKKFTKRISRGSRNGKEDGKFRLVYHGTITQRLGIDLLVETVARLKQEIPELELHVWGSGEYLGPLRRQCRELGVQERVFLHDMVPVEDLPDVLGNMDLGVIPNRSSIATDLMLPVKLLEYVSLGIPAIAPRLKAIEYYFTDEMLTFFEPENLDAMAEAILEAYKNTSRGKAQASKAEAFLARYGWEKHSLDFIRFYEGL